MTAIAANRRMDQIAVWIDPPNERASRRGVDRPMRLPARGHLSSPLFDARQDKYHSTNFGIPASIEVVG